MNRRLAAGAVFAMLASASCSVPVDREAIELPTLAEVEVQFTSTTTTVSAQSPRSSAPPSAKGVILYFIRGEGLTGRPAVVFNDYSVTTLLQFLIDGPNAADSGSLRSGLGQRADLVERAEVLDRVATIDLATALSDLPGSEQVLILGQITLTLVSNLNIDGVTFRQNGQPVVVPGADGQPKSGAVTRADYVALLTKP